ncbi:hypothetical protein I4F81_001623 [Pyropia yezoensis]|uniref:Uncharacterized protein n=1 Tax=Pyropia yezoensis TaxID=2788 RepID=A0ACC3BMP6_PYRYE|nr:hypothetical protein I4F81_001623 [Neopyropia yezoensis]
MLLATALAASLIATAAAQGPDRTNQAAGVRARDGTCLLTDPCDGQRINMRPFFVFQNSCGDDYLLGRHCGVSLARNAALTVTSSVGNPTLTDEPPPTVTLGTPTLTAVSRRAAKAKAADAAKAASKA